MPGLMPGIHVFDRGKLEGADGRDKPGHDDRSESQSRNAIRLAFFCSTKSSLHCNPASVFGADQAGGRRACFERTSYCKFIARNK